MQKSRNPNKTFFMCTEGIPEKHFKTKVSTLSITVNMHKPCDPEREKFIVN